MKTESPRPWRINYAGDIVDANNKIVCAAGDGFLTSEAKETTVRAVNSYDAMVEALEKAERAIQKVASISDENRLGWALKDINAALALAKEGQPLPPPPTFEKGKE